MALARRYTHRDRLEQARVVFAHNVARHLYRLPGPRGSSRKRAARRHRSKRHHAQTPERPLSHQGGPYIGRGSPLEHNRSDRAPSRRERSSGARRKRAATTECDANGTAGVVDCTADSRRGAREMVKPPVPIIPFDACEPDDDMPLKLEDAIAQHESRLGRETGGCSTMIETSGRSR